MVQEERAVSRNQPTWVSVILILSILKCQGTYNAVSDVAREYVGCKNLGFPLSEICVAAVQQSRHHLFHSICPPPCTFCRLVTFTSIERPSSMISMYAL